ncbi:MAG: hypothetical protein ACRDLC_05940, partial [Actinomycetota bacterium]
MQPFLTAGSLDLSARICVVAFSVAIPLLAGLLVLNRQEIFRGRATGFAVVEVTKVVAQTCAFTPRNPTTPRPSFGPPHARSGVRARGRGDG